MATIWTQADIDALKLAISQSGAVLSVSYSGPPARSVTYRSLAEMRDLLAEMEASIATEEPTRFRRARVMRGFRSGQGRSWRWNE